MKLSPLVTLYDLGAESDEVAESRVRLPQVPSSAFGDGTHPTTRLCAGAVDLICRQHRPRAILDVGTGTGVLARIARARGTMRIVATDIDPQALQAARANAQLDRHSIEIELSDRAPDHWGPNFDLVVANILEGPLRQLAPSIARAVAPGGRLLVSGFTPPQCPFLRIPYSEQGLDFVSEARLEGWALLAFRKPA